MIELNKVTRYFGDLLAVDNVSFNIEAGEIVGLLGPNGAGKSTVMKMIGGIIEPTRGDIFLNSVDIYQQPEIVKSRLGLLPETSSLYPEMKVIDYLYFVAQVRKINKEKLWQAIYKVINQTQLDKVLFRPIKELSRGFQQRVGVAQALLHQPDILILDEPTNGLDPLQVLSMRELIKSLASKDNHQNGKPVTVLLSTHVLQEVEAMCSRVIMIDRGKLILDKDVQTQDENVLEIICDTNKEKITLCLKAAELEIPIKKIEQINTTNKNTYLIYPLLKTLQKNNKISEKDKQNWSAEINRTLVQAGIHPNQIAFKTNKLDEIYLNAFEQQRDAIKH